VADLEGGNVGSPLIRAQTLALVLRGYLQTGGAFFSAADVTLCATNLERACTGPYPQDAPTGQQVLAYNQLPAGY
jgi:hypothetical protein